MEKNNNNNKSRLMRNHHHPPVATVIPRSISMSTLPCALSCESLKPRISRLETLEAKMANIEVSLSSDPQQQQQQRRKNIKMANDHEINPRRVHDINLANDRITKLIREVDLLRRQINEQEVIISTVTQQNNKLVKQISNGESNRSNEMRVKEERMKEIQEEMGRRRRVVNNLKLTMDKMKDTDLDAQIHHAETENRIGKEELIILNLQQEFLSLKTFVDEKKYEIHSKMDDTVTFSSILGWNESVSLVSVQVEYNPNEPGFVIAPHSSGKGLFVQWTREDSNLHKGDRLVEVNGHFLLGGVREDLIRVLVNATTSKPLELVVLRPSFSSSRQINIRELDNLKEEIACVVNKLDMKIRENKQLLTSSEKVKKERDHLQKENMKLGHRISYLEEQVSELQEGWEDVRQTLNQVETSKEKKNIKLTGTTSITITQAQQKTTRTATNSSTSSISVGNDNNSSLKSNFTDTDSPRTRKSTNSHKRTSSTSAVQLIPSSAVIKSPSVGQLDHMTNSEYTRHILQVHVPFPTSNDNSQFLPLVRSASANGYTNSRGSREVVERRQNQVSPAKLAIHLKVNNKKIALDDFESENEEWC